MKNSIIAADMTIPGLRTWALVVLGYWLLVAAIVVLEIVYMESDWAGLPGLVLSLPLSVLVVAVYFFAEYSKATGGYSIEITGYHLEFAFLACAFLNAFIFYPLWWWWTVVRRARRESKPAPPPAPTFQ